MDPALGQGDAQLLRGLHERDLAVGLQLRQTVLHGHGAVVRRHGDGGEVKARRAHRVDHALHGRGREHHEARDGLTDDGIQGNEDGEGQEAPQAAAHGVDAFLCVEPLQLLVHLDLIVLIAGQMRLIYQVKLLDRKGYNDKEIGKILGVNPYRLKYVRQEGKDFDLNELLQCLDDLSRLDVEIKTGKMDKKMGLELFMVRI